MQYFATESGNRWHIERQGVYKAPNALYMLCGLIFYSEWDKPQSLVDVDSSVVCKNCKRWSEKNG